MKDAHAPDETKEFAGVKGAPREVAPAPPKLAKLARALEELTKLADAPEDRDLAMSAGKTTLGHAPEELIDITELKELLVEERPLDLTELIEDVRNYVQDFRGPNKAIQHIDFLTSAVTTYCTQHRTAFAVFQHASTQQIGKFEAAIQALNQTPESVSRALPNCALTLMQALHSKSSSPGIDLGSEFGDTAQDDLEAATSQPTS